MKMLYCVFGNRRFAAVALSILGGQYVLSQEPEVKDTTASELVALDEVLVSAVRVTAQNPVTFSNLTKEDIASRNLGQDIPVLMNYLPSVVTTSDAGAGVGYTGIRVRGSDATRVNVTINGIPYNDSESHGSFWVNMPDFASSVENMQLQRGVGTSTNGAGAFGASLNLLTDAVAEEAGGEIANSYGSFNTRKHTLKFTTGKLNEHFEMSGRLSAIRSDGYVDRASSDLKSYFLQGAYVDENTLVKALVFGGHETTYQSWNGIDAETLKTDRRYNSAGQYTDEEGNTRFYDNEVDDYKQDHAQLHWSQQWSDRWSTNLALHYTYGRGYFEQYGEDRDFADYGLEPVIQGGDTVNTTDLIGREWLDNDFYGTTFSVHYEEELLDVVVGGAWNKYEGDHFGDIVWARYASQSEIRDRYYDDNSLKTDFNVFAKVNYKLGEHWNLFGDMQYRGIGYEANGAETGLVDDTFGFFNPKAGVTYIVNPGNSFYFSYARAGREPNRSDYKGGNPKPEYLNDFELGWRHLSGNVRLNANAYYMRYKDQLVLTGELDNVGAPIRRNSGDSYRLGLEVDATVMLSDRWVVRPNIALSDNRNVDYVIETEEGVDDLGNTEISFSPGIIAGNALTFLPVDNLQLSLLSKYVGKQYMDNTGRGVAALSAYFVNDLNVSLELEKVAFFRSVTISGLVNNFLDEKYESNGYMYDPTSPYYYPQAGINFLVGLNLKI
ncbi:TonB-dependent receptor [Sinomicrobium soli]|uniref:TonB-dependent receptor n=1 Tax=Sinomicrobium sp. N-1-3-6 TaxID=2219864 RepID=UPI000DCE318C|nr:TonB-dependent receptor [Sinomicrobium sp. N-1-3-6]RAV28533.1 TonB-dependent receptor [Sinomicrobium sp. N-1-3-6]